MKQTNFSIEVYNLILSLYFTEDIKEGIVGDLYELTDEMRRNGLTTVNIQFFLIKFIFDIIIENFKQDLKSNKIINFITEIYTDVMDVIHYETLIFLIAMLSALRPLALIRTESFLKKLSNEEEDYKYYRNMR